MYRIVMMCSLVGLSSSVLAQICQNTIIASAPDTRYQVVAGSQGAEVLDLSTNLIWQRCSIGQQWTGTQCRGEAHLFAWADALKQVGQPNSVWRVPNIRELQSLIEDACYDSSINYTFFPDTPAQSYWSSSPHRDNPLSAWSVSFKNGLSGSPRPKSSLYAVRLVRSVATSKP